LYVFLASAVRTGSNAFNQSYGYDPTNRTSIVSDGVTTSATYDNAHQMISLGGTSSTYDRNGNLTGGGGNRLSYDTVNKWTGGTFNG